MSKNNKEEQAFIHDLVNKLTIAKGKISRMITKSEQFTKEELVEIAKQAEIELDTAFELIKARKNTMMD